MLPTVLITGASQGCGRETALLFARSNAIKRPKMGEWFKEMLRVFPATAWGCPLTCPQHDINPFNYCQ